MIKIRSIAQAKQNTNELETSFFSNQADQFLMKTIKS